MTSPYMAAVGLPGLEVEQRGLYASLLEEIRGRQLNARSLKVGLVHELSQLVFCPSGNKLISEATTDVWEHFFLTRHYSKVVNCDGIGEIVMVHTNPTGYIALCIRVICS